MPPTDSPMAAPPPSQIGPEPHRRREVEGGPLERRLVEHELRLGRAAKADGGERGVGQVEREREAHVDRARNVGPVLRADVDARGPGDACVLPVERERELAVAVAHRHVQSGRRGGRDIFARGGRGIDVGHPRARQPGAARAEAEHGGRVGARAGAERGEREGRRAPAASARASQLDPDPEGHRPERALPPRASGTRGW